MNLYAVGFMNFIDNELTIELIEAKNIVGAIAMHSKVDAEWLKNYPNDMRQLRMLFAELDCAVDVVEITWEQSVARTFKGQNSGSQDRPESQSD